jgi:hypothetical protein
MFSVSAAVAAFLAREVKILPPGPVLRGHQIGPGRRTLYTYHKTIGASKYDPRECRARGCR